MTENARTRAAVRIGLLSKHFPPSEEAGALRWQKLGAMAQEFGFDLTVVTRSFDELERRDDRRLADLSSSVRIVQVATPQSSLHGAERALVRLRQGLRSILPTSRTAVASHGTTPMAATAASIGRTEARGPLHSRADLARAYHALSLRAAEVSWANAAAAALGRESPQPDILVSCGPPHQVHRAASTLSRRAGVPHVIDMRDPWSLVERVPAPFGSSLLWALADRDEFAAFENARLIVVNTEAHASVLRQRYPQLATRIIAVLNGFDDEALPPADPQPQFTIVYAGTIYLDRDPAELLQPVADLVARERLAPRDLRVTFVGSVESTGGATLEQVAESLGLAGFVRVLGRVSRAEAMRVLATADLNVVLPQDSHLAVPSKVYEYLRFPAWLLAIADPVSATAQTLQGTGADIVAPGDRAAVAEVLRRRMAERAASGRPAALAASAPHLSRRAQGEALFTALARLTSG